MHRHHGLRFALPACRFGPPSGRFTATAVSVALLLGACGGTDRSGDEVADRTAAKQIDENAEAASGRDDAADGDARQGERLSFGDPADFGFDPVSDDDVDSSQPTADGARLFDDDQPADGPAADSPDEVIPEINRQLAAAPKTDEILDAVDVIDGATDVATDRDGRPRNVSGEPVTLDDEASLACAHAEIGVGQLDAGQVSVALERIATTAHHAGRSGRAAIREWAEPLSTVVVDGAVVDLAPLVGFLSVCTEGGYEL